MNTRKYGNFVLLILLAIQIPMATTFRVAKDGSATYTSVQKAVDAAGPNDIVEITDFGVYEEQVTIDSSKNGLTLKSSNPTSSKKPVIKYQDVTNVLPKTYHQSQYGDSINFDQNGALRVMRARNVTINGIKVDGDGAAPFRYPGIWNQKDPLFHGNAALTLWVAGDVVVKNCEFYNAYFGINVKDRNEGGIFANANPADIEPWNVVPLSGFGKTGNHLFEDNKIHNNSWGMFFESAWDLGSVIRYNLFYENHHSKKAAAFVTADDNQPGGGIFFKDMLLTPLAIYNNTFWHNKVIYGGHWRPAANHLIFNNIIAQPDSLYNNFQSLDPKFVNRMHNCLYACQEQKPQMRSQRYNTGMSDPETNEYVEADSNVVGAGNVRVMNGMDKLQAEGQEIVLTIPLSSGPVTKTINAEWIIQPGALITNFPAGAEIRWFEMKFLSTDTSSPDFLVPDWDNPDVERLVLDKGWAASGVVDADGSIADIGARPKGGRATNQVMIKPAEPVMINGTKATAIFDVYGLENSSLSDLKVKYVRWIKNITFQADAFGGDVKVIPAGDVVKVDIPPTPIKAGSNTLEFTIPARAATELYAFFEIILEGQNSEGETEATNVGFLPYRKLDYIFDVKILDLDGKKELPEVKVGQNVLLKIVPKRVGDGGVFANKVSPVAVTLGSGLTLINATTNDTLKIDAIQDERIETVVFTQIPRSGYERVSVSGLYQQYVFRGSTEVKILPGDPEKVEFDAPPSGGSDIINPGPPYEVKVKVTDKFGNLVGAGAQVKVRSTMPLIGDILDASNKESGGVDVIGTTDSTGFAWFNAVVTEGDLHDTFPLVATLVLNGALDNSKLVVGQAKPRFFILFGDSSQYAEELRGCAGQKFPVTIIGSLYGDSVLTDLTSAFDIDLDNGISAYATDLPDDTTRITSSALVNGKKVIWIKSTSGQHTNKKISVSPSVGNAPVAATKAGIYFDFCGPVIERASYSAMNGNGQVDRLDIWYKEAIESFERPDSFQLYWPDELPGYVRLVRKTDETFIIDQADARHLTVLITEKFDPRKTSSHKTRLGTSFWNDINQPEAATVKNPFSITDSVGPVLTFAKVVEKLQPGNDTLYICFSEDVRPELIKGITLSVIKNGGTSLDLTVLDAITFGDTTMIVVKDEGANSPQYGDSLKIISAGTIADLYGNKAHPENRPVPIIIKMIPASIKEAYYIDEYPDGIVDHVVVRFDKYVIKDGVAITCKWPDGNNVTSLLTANDFTYSPVDNNVIILNVQGKFVVNEVRTSGPMMISVLFTDFGNVERVAQVADSAAPVLVKAVYCPGNYKKETDSFGQDKLIVTFSEETNYTFTSPVPFPFNFSRQGIGYTINFQTTPVPVNKGFEFTVAEGNSIQGVAYPEKQDSVNINVNPAAFFDNFNYQIRPNNRKVALEVQASETFMEIKVGPNPCIAGQGVNIYITPRAKMVENVNLSASVVIYDRMGNKIWQQDANSLTQPVDYRRTIKMNWNGYNKSGRLVGNGTYMVKVSAVDNSTSTKARETQEFLVGVKKN